MKQILLRHVPDDLHKRLKAGAAMAGESLQDYIVEILTREVGKKKRKAKT